MIIGDFFPDRDYRMELALLGSDGMIHIIKRGDLDTRPVTNANFSANRSARRGPRECR